MASLRIIAAATALAGCAASFDNAPVGRDAFAEFAVDGALACSAPDGRDWTTRHDAAGTLRRTWSDGAVSEGTWRMAGAGRYCSALDGGRESCFAVNRSGGAMRFARQGETRFTCRRAT